MTVSKSITTLLFLFIPLVLLAHGTGITVEEVIDGYFIDIGISEPVVMTGEPVRFDFSLYDEATNEAVPFNDIWVRMDGGEQVYFAGGISKPQFGVTGFTYIFKVPGDYSISARFQKDGTALVEHAFTLNVGDSGNESGSSTPPSIGYIISALIAFAVGYGIAFFVGKRGKGEITSGNATSDTTNG